MNLRGEPANVGRHCGGNRYDITPEIVAFYADALDDRHPLTAKRASLLDVTALRHDRPHAGIVEHEP